MILQIGLWTAQILLALAFAFTGTGSLTRPIDDLAEVAVWPGEVPAALVRAIGAAELAGALGLILPSLTRIRPSLTPLAAAGLAGVMLLAASYNLFHGRWPALALNLVLGSMAVFVAWGRSWRLPIVRPTGGNE
ncbi:MAG TPA: DoxX family protein [Longimicrobiales bacterium]